MSHKTVFTRTVSESCDETLDLSTLKDCMEKQMIEIEMIQSMYPNPGELVLYNYREIDDIDSYLNGKDIALLERIDFVLKLNCEENIFELSVNLPLNYPNIEPDIFVRNNDLSRNKQHELNDDICKYVNNLDKGDICLYLVILWIQDNWKSYIVKVDELSEKNETLPKENDTFSRFWIYSHHIYSKTKRDEILNLADYYKITGFCLPGKPGIICIEGNTVDCGNWWSRIKSMNWKKITLKFSETHPMDSFEADRKFSGFIELNFSSNKSNRTNEHHMDMGELLKYLESHNCAYGFNYYFGLK